MATNPSCSDNSEPTIVVKTSNEDFNVPISLLKQSKVFNDMIVNSLADFGGKNDVELKNLDGKIFGKVLEWLKEHQDQPDPKIVVDPHTKERKWLALSGFQRAFFNEPIDILEGLLGAANFLDIPSLYIYSCQAIAGNLKGKSADQIREILQLPDDLSEAEKEKIRNSYAWGD